MSDRSDQSDLSGGDEDNLDYEPETYEEYGDQGPESGEDDEDEEEYDPDDEDEEEVDRPKVVKDNLNLCPKHGYGEMTKSCLTCSAAFSMIKDKKTIKELCSSGSSKEDDLLSRYGGRVDSVKPTLSLDQSTLKLAKKIFSQGVFRDSKLWTEIVRQHLTLTPEQHEELNSDIQSESLLKKYKREKRFRHIFNYQKEMIDFLRNLRISQRPLFSLIERIFVDLSKVRSIGGKAGLVYPDVAPDKVSEVNVPKREVPDKLKYSDKEELLPRPDVQTFIQNNNLDLDTANNLITLLEDYRKSVGSKFMELYKVCSDSLNASEDLLVFYTNLLGHIDSSCRDLARNKVACLFRGDIKTDVLEQTSSKKMKDEKSTGLFGGQLDFYFLLYLYFL